MSQQRWAALGQGAVLMLFPAALLVGASYSARTDVHELTKLLYVLSALATLAIVSTVIDRGRDRAKEDANQASGDPLLSRIIQDAGAQIAAYEAKTTEITKYRKQLKDGIAQLKDAGLHDQRRQLECIDQERAGQLGQAEERLRKWRFLRKKALALQAYQRLNQQPEADAEDHDRERLVAAYDELQGLASAEACLTEDNHAPV